MRKPHLVKMRLLTLGTWSLASSVACAFRDTSPFFYLSTEERLLSSDQITTSSDLLSSVDSQLLRNNDNASHCPVNTYVVAILPEISLHVPNLGAALPSLRKWFSIEGSTYKSKFSISQVSGKENAENLIRLVQARCGRNPDRINLQAAQIPSSVFVDNHPRLIVLDASQFNEDGAVHRSLDVWLSNAIQQLPKQDHTLFIASNPLFTPDIDSSAETASYEMDDSQWPLRMEMKRDLTSHKRADNTNLSNGPLFERYQFLTPGIFMGIFTTLILIAVGYVGIYALGSLQVSYAAFDKENGPQAQKNKAQ